MASGGSGEPTAVPEPGPSESSVYDRGEAICVIGAGSSGLAAIKNLRQRGFDVDCYERETDIGGAWNWRHDRSPMYASTHLISSKPLTQFPDFPMPDDWPDYISHHQLLSYFRRYADHFGLREHIWFGTEVHRLEPVGDGRWHVMVRPRGSRTLRILRYTAVVIANGHNWDPKLPSYQGQDGFTGRVMHASEYKDPSVLRGRRVLVVGGGNTGCDIAVEGAQQATKTWHSTRRGYWLAPKYALGRPADQVGDAIARLRLPLRVRQWLAQLTLRTTVGRLERFGLPKPDHRIFETHPIVNSQLLYYLGHGQVTPKPDVAHFDHDRVVFSDGTHANPELVVFATGYRPRFEFLDSEHLNADPEGRPRLHLQMFAPQHMGLFVAGLIQSDSGQFPLVHWQTVAIAEWLRSCRSAPERARAYWSTVAAGAGRRWSATKTVDTSRHWFEVGHHRYLKALERTINELAAER
ncbi:MAG: flavin-containing monooxygenase [Micromonosporaceae bacterium]